MAAQTYTYSLTKKEWMSAAFISVRRKPSLLTPFILMAIWLLMFLGVSVFSVIQEFRSRPFTAVAFLPMLVFILFGALFASFALYRIRREISKVMVPNWETEIDLSFDDVALTLSVPGVSECRYFWPPIWGLSETSKFGLIYLTKETFIAFPKRALPFEITSFLRAYIQRDGKRR